MNHHHLSVENRVASAESQLAPADLDLGPATIDCWNQIGVSGNQTCGELTRYIHCHHCPVYGAAAVRLLDRPLSADDRREWTVHYAQEQRLGAPAKTSTLLFRLGTEWLALPTSAFQEIANHRVLHRLPHRRLGIVLGLINVRGELLLCASLSRLLRLAPEVRPPTADRRSLGYDRLLVADWNGQRVAFPVDEVYGVHRFHQADLRDPPYKCGGGEGERGIRPAARRAPHSALVGGVFPWRDLTVGFLDADAVFAALNRNLS